MAATITSTSARITISGNYKAFTADSGNTTTVIQYNSGDAPASGDAGRFLMWKNGADTGDWEIRFIESATSTTVTVGDGGFSSAPSSGDSFVISTNLEDCNTALASSVMRASGSSYQMLGRDFELASDAFLADVNASLVTESTQTGSGFISTYPIADGCALQFGRLIGGEANDSTETIGGCQITFEVANNTLMFTNQGSASTTGAILNFYGCLIESFDNGFSPFIRSPGPMRLIGSICDGAMGGRLYSSASELVSTRFSGNTSGGIAWSLGGVFTRPIDDAFFFQGDTAIKAFQGFTGAFTNVTFADSVTNIINSDSAQSSLLFTFTDCTTFADGKITANNGQYTQAKSINYTVADTSGTGLTGVKVAVYDTDGDIQTGIQTSSSGAVTQIEAVFFDKAHNAAATTKSPFDIRLRKYGYEYQDFQSAVSEPIKQEYRLPTNAVTVLSEAAAAALTFITIDFAAKTVTVERERTLSEIYDYCQSQLALDANMDEPEFLTSQDGVTFTFADDWDLILDASGKVGSASGKTLVFNGTGVLEMLDNRNMIDNLTVNGDVYINNAMTLSGGTLSKVVTPSGFLGTLTLNNTEVTEVENTSGSSVTVLLTNGSSIPTLTETSGALVVSNDMSLTFTGLTSGDTVYVEDDLQTQQLYTTSGGATQELNITRDNDGETWRYVVNRVGYEHTRGTFTVAEGTSASISISFAEKKLPDGTAAYSGSSSPLVSVDLSDLATPLACINIANGEVSGQVVFDEFEDALLTADGMAWLAQQNADIFFTTLPTSGQLIVLDAKIRLCRASSGDSNAAVGAYVQSQDGIVVDNTNGSVAYVASIDAQAISEAVWNALSTTHNTPGSYGELLESFPTAEENADAVWDEAAADHETSGTTGELIKKAKLFAQNSFTLSA